MKKVIIKPEPDVVKKVVENVLFKKIQNIKWSESQIDAFVEKDILAELYSKNVIFQKKTESNDITPLFHLKIV